MTGTIKMVNNEKGFGFIKCGNGEEYFFHKSALIRGLTFGSLDKGMGVTFDVGNGPKGPRAENVSGR